MTAAGLRSSARVVQSSAGAIHYESRVHQAIAWVHAAAKGFTEVALRIDFVAIDVSFGRRCSLTRRRALVGFPMLRCRSVFVAQWPLSKIIIASSYTLSALLLMRGCSPEDCCPREDLVPERSLGREASPACASSTAYMVNVQVARGQDTSTAAIGTASRTCKLASDQAGYYS